MSVNVLISYFSIFFGYFKEKRKNDNFIDYDVFIWFLIYNQSRNAGLFN